VLCVGAVAVLSNEGFNELSNLILLMARKSADRIENAANTPGWAVDPARFCFAADARAKGSVLAMTHRNN